MAKEKFTLRYYDMFDGWIDVMCDKPKDVIQKEYDLHTKNGTIKTKYEDGEYYKIFPADTKMLITPESLGR